MIQSPSNKIFYFEGGICKESLGRLDITGPDALNYLSKQLTSDVLSLEKDSFQVTSIVDLSGKIESSFYLLKKSNDHLIILVQNNILNQTLDRIEKFHISEDFEIKVTESQASSFILGKEQLIHEGFTGSIGLDVFKISFSCLTPSIDQKEFDNYLLECGHRYEVGELINNTNLEQTAVSFSKGCFPGQETVSKIHTRRGAAFKDAILSFNEAISFNNRTDLFNEDGKKVGKSYFQLDDNNLYVQLNRESRVDGKNLKVSLRENLITGKVSSFNFPASLKEYKAQLVYDHAMDLFYNNKDERAVEFFNYVINLDPRFVDAYESLGVLYGRLENYQKAVELMHQLSCVDSSSVMAHTNLSMYYMKLGDKDKAEDHKSQATLKQFEFFGTEAQKKKELEKAKKQKEDERESRKKMYFQVLEIDEGDPLANFGLGSYSLEEGEYVEAAKYLSVAIKGDKKYSVAYLALSKSFIGLNEFDKAKDTLEKGIEVASKNGDMMPANEMQQLLNIYSV